MLSGVYLKLTKVHYHVKLLSNRILQIYLWTLSGRVNCIKNKFYVDEAYHLIFVKPYYALARVLNNVVDKKGIDGIVNGVGRGINYSSRQLRLLQSGQVGSYLLLMVIGLLILFIIQMFTK